MKQLGELCVADVMTMDPVCARVGDRLVIAIRLFDEKNLSALPVIDADRVVVGILSLVDLLEEMEEIQSDLSAMNLVGGKTRSFLLKLLAQDEERTQVGDRMTQPVATVTPDTNAVVAAKMMLQGKFRHLPVVDDDGKAVGILSTTDFVRAFAQQAPLLAG